MRRLWMLLFLLTAVLLPGGTAQAAADEDTTDAETEAPDAEAEAPVPLWATSLGFSYVANTGNTDNESGGLDFKTERRPTPWGLEIVANVNRGLEDGEITAERYFVNGRAKRALTERWRLFVGALGEVDEFSGIELRSLYETGGTYDALHGESHTLSFDLGMSYTDEDRLPPDADVSYFGGLTGLDYRWNISDSAWLGQRLRYYANFDNSSDWRADSITTVNAALTSRFAIQLALDIRHRNEPLFGNQPTDTTTRASLVATF